MGMYLSAPLALAALSLGQSGPVQLPGGGAVREVSFERHVAGLLGKFGCNAGSCHGSFQGRGGMRLSLFGHDSAMDYLALTHDALGRRVDPANPDSSLVLLKAAGQVSHGGGKRFDKGSWAYQVIRSWVEAGCPRGAGAGQVRQLTVSPAESSFRSPGQAMTLRVEAEFADGTRQDVTPFCSFRAQDDTIADVSPFGKVVGLRPGETPIVVSYLSQLTSARVLVPVAVAKDFVYPAVPESNFIDREVFVMLRRLNIVPSELSGDAEFLRRVTIDTVGRLPLPEEIRAFLADSRPDKRRRKIEELLADPLHSALWATRFCDITGLDLDSMEGPEELKVKRARMWHDWFRRRFAENMPYDRIAHGVLCATSRSGADVATWLRRETELAGQLHRGLRTSYAHQPGLDLFWRRFSGEDYFPVEQMAERAATAFLGVRIECAQCHKHPFDRWTQADYRAFANVFAQVRFGGSPEVTAAVADLLARRREDRSGKKSPPLPRVREVYLAPMGERALTHPETNGPLPPRALGGPALTGSGDLREGLLHWLTGPANPFFARSFVNRVWAHYLGRGLVEPVDSFSAANPPSNAPLLDALAQDFVEHGYDIHRLERLILNSRVYQLTSRPNETNRGDRTHYSHALARPLLAEVVVDVLSCALGVPEDLGADAPPGSRAIEVAPNRVKAPHLARIFRVFGRPARTSTCDCERPRQPAIGQTLFLMTDTALLKRMQTGRLGRLLAANRTNAQIVEELFLATLSRPPDDAERQAAVDQVCAAPNALSGFTDVLWALINTREFILNH
jgi:hypothetical protein